MRIAHITDIHVERLPGVGELFNKRAAGVVNLYLLGRSSHFTVQSQGALVAKVLELAPDLVLCTGDVTATATEAEFAAARELFAPLSTRFPFLCIPGNHDVYTRESVGRYARYFGSTEPVRSSRHGEIEVVCVDVCHPDWLSRGALGQRGITQLDQVLGASTTPTLVAIHYPLRGRHGNRYGPATRALVDAADVEAVLVKHPHVRWVVHGHEHHGYQTAIPREGVPIVSIDPGAGGYAYLPARGRTAHFCVYPFDGVHLGTVERYQFDGDQFVPEPGGAFATGG